MKVIKYILLLAGCFFLINCGNKSDKEQVEEEETQETSYEKLPDIVEISDEKLITINKWAKFKELSELMVKFQRQTRGDLSYFSEEFIRLDKEMDSVPPKFDIPEVKSRMVVFKTFAYQLGSRLNENAPVDSINVSRARVFNAYNAIRIQLSESLKSKIYQEFLEEN
ncbi:hypothetical protein OOZ15_13455 [Galbibacter sp. EGI 63066]|uniref:hypothetical protein n=1 Tax=Galbibacter sp. EGI 63066 TaxID=2993559 RepID=UPI0022498416|nr:hypothetical protein [Galbibacter sp. EGI 63066]MCX2680954.1 hypothetical protein [Galbibacter sp. EGI 63066]